MSLDVHVKALLDQMKTMALPKMWELGPQAARAAMKMGIFRGSDSPIGKVEERNIPGPAGFIPLRVYTPLGVRDDTLPGLVFFHGGGFVIGDLDTHDGLCRQLANASGCRVISVAYRLAPEHKFPAAVDDAYAAVSWVAEHAREFGVDSDRIAVGGDSAGGNLAAVVCQLAKERGGPKIALQLLLYPATESGVDTPSRVALAEGYLLEKKSIEWFLQQYVERGTDPIDPRLSPLLAPDLSGLPPAHIHTAEFDPLVDEGKAYADKLAAAGVEVEYTCHPGMIHHFFCLAGAIPYARTAIANAGAAMKQALAPGRPAAATAQRRASAKR
jgi:acetyl esterase